MPLQRSVLADQMRWRWIRSGWWISSTCCLESTRRCPSERDPEELLRFEREFHRQVLKHFLAEAAHDQRDRVLGAEPALLAVEDLILADLGRRRFVLDRRRAVADLDVRERVRAALIADEHRVALRVIPCAGRARQHLHLAAIAVVAVTSGDAFGDDRRLRVPAHVDHLRAGVGLLAVVDDGDGVELAGRVVALQDDARILPRDRRTRLDLRPRDLRARRPRLCRASSRSCRCRLVPPRRPRTSSAPSST